MAYIALSNFKHNSTAYEQGNVIEGLSDDEVQTLLDAELIAEADPALTVQEVPAVEVAPPEQPVVEEAQVEGRPLDGATSADTDPSLPAQETVTVNEAPQQPEPEVVQIAVEQPVQPPAPETPQPPAEEVSSGDLHIS